MTVPNNAYRRQDQTNTFEDYEDVIYDVSPDVTPVVSALAQRTATNSKVEWTQDRLDDPANQYTTPNARLDGDGFTAAAITPPERLNNECQVQRKDFAITRRAQIIEKAGEDDEVARQSIRKGIELRRDMEAAVTANVAKRAETGTTVALLAGMPTWIAGTADGRANRGATGADGAGDGSTAKTDGTKRALSEVGLLGVQEAVYKKSRVLPDTLLFDTTSKRNFSRYMFSSSARIANQYQDQGSRPSGGLQVSATVGIWETDFGRVDVTPDIFMSARAETTGYDSFFYATEMLGGAFLTNMRVYVMGKVADTEDRIVLTDWTFCPKNTDSLGTFADIDESLDMVA